MSPTPQDSLVVGLVAPAEAAEALRLVFGGLADGQDEEYVQVTAAAMARGEVSSSGLFEARRGRNRVGAAWFQVLAGNAALVWPPRLVPGEATETAERLMAAGCDWLAASGVAIANAILASVVADEDRVLRAAGFLPVARLLYLVSEESRFPVERPRARVAFEPWCPSEQDRLARLLQATFEGTLDCADVNDPRPPEDILAGYRATGVFSPEHWLFVRDGARDVGCLLLADHPAAENMELVYMGIVPSSRHQGFGAEVCRYAQWLSRRAGRRRLVAAVDAANQPAVRMYLAAGFAAWDSRAAYVRQFRG